MVSVLLLARNSIPRDSVQVLTGRRVCGVSPVLRLRRPKELCGAGPRSGRKAEPVIPGAARGDRSTRKSPLTAGAAWPLCAAGTLRLAQQLDWPGGQPGTGGVAVGAASKESPAGPRVLTQN